MEYKPILIVEDDESICLSLQELFEGRGHPVLLARDGQAALDLLQLCSTPKPGLILLDHMMPVMDGPTFLLKLRKDHSEQLCHTPVFMMSARVVTLQPTMMITGFLKKPFELLEFCKIAAQYCSPIRT